MARSCKTTPGEHDPRHARRAEPGRSTAARRVISSYPGQGHAPLPSHRRGSRTPRRAGPRRARSPSTPRPSTCGRSGFRHQAPWPCAPTPEGRHQRWPSTWPACPEARRDRRGRADALALPPGRRRSPRSHRDRPAEVTRSSIQPEQRRRNRGGARWRAGPKARSFVARDAVVSVDRVLPPQAMITCLSSQSMRDGRERTRS